MLPPTLLRTLILPDTPTSISNTDIKIIPDVSSLQKAVFSNRSLLTELEISEIFFLPKALYSMGYKRGILSIHFVQSTVQHLKLNSALNIMCHC